MKNVGIFLSRFSPPHLGHIKVIEEMCKECKDGQLLLIGSSNTERNIRVPFNYMERKIFLRKIFPTIKIIGIPDVNEDDVWISMLDDIISSVFGECEPVFYGGSVKDVEFYYNYGKIVKIINRQELPINATAIRQMMMLGLDISSMVHEKIAEDVVEKFKEIMSTEF